jgi:arginase family enzyme
MSAVIFVCPFAQFGNPGTQRGAEALGDAVREMLDDARAESRTTRLGRFADLVRVEELPLETPADYSQWRERSREVAREALDRGEFLLWIGGNHLSVMPVYEELAEQPGAAIVQFDAHLDVYHYNDVYSSLTHGNFIRHLERRPKLVNIGHRDLFLPPGEIRTYFDVAVAATSDASTRRVENAVARSRPICLDVDWDVLDPAFFPAVDDPMPAGLSPRELIAWFQRLWSDRIEVVCFSEFNSGRDDRSRSLELAVWMVEQALLWRFEAKPARRKHGRS